MNLMLLLSDGTVMASRNDGSTFGIEWYRLTPGCAWQLCQWNVDDAGVDARFAAVLFHRRY